MSLRTRPLVLVAALGLLLAGVSPAAGAGPDPVLAWSARADMAGPRPLDGATLDEHVAVWLDGDRDVATVTFALDGRTTRTERMAPFTLLGDDKAGRAYRLDTADLGAGPHDVRATVTTRTGERRTVTATFRVGDAAPVPPTRPVPPPRPDPEVPGPAGDDVLAVRGEGFTLDGRPFDMWGVRTASATVSDAQTEHLVAQLDDYRAHGVNTVAVYWMGSRSANHNPFSSDGRRLDPDHVRRMVRIVEEAADRDMVVLVGIFYQAAPFTFRDADAVRAAVRTATTALLPHRNVVLNIANEQNSEGYRDSEDVYDLRDPARVVELLRIVHEVDPERVAGAGGYDRARNVAIGRSPEADVLLFDTGDAADRVQLSAYRAYRAAGIDTPMVNVEQYGGYTNGRPRGVFDADLRAEYRGEVASAAAEPGLSTFFHNGPWFQVLPMRYDLGGAGTAEDPGVRWYFELVRAARAGG
ncbi:hypothetical protein [Cellulomonas endophytica]|uniref:hypothetical protein n=1 Tax=Cellulomonas endophytica TaxID=2494735 RepID=UPI0013E92B9C|nr:hypothetical protein [Cellulomonas endophytica]